MSNQKAKRLRLLITVTITLTLIIITTSVIKFAKGYRPNLKQGSLNGTGLLSTTSYPKSAQVFINDRLTTLTDDTLYLPPNTYIIKITKEGFTPWQKTIPVSSELVSLTDARLFPSLPSISPITFSGVQKPALNPDGSKIAFIVNQAEPITNNGIYVLSLNNNLLGSTQITQITDNSVYDYSQASLFWSPDSSQILAIIHNQQKTIIASHLLKSKNFNQPSNLTDITISLPLIIKQWQEQLIKKEQTAFRNLPQFMIKLLTSKAVNVYFSPDQEKILYTAKDNHQLPENKLKQTLPSINPAPEQRNLQKNSTYIYDIKEDTNYLIQANNPSQKTDKILKLSTVSTTNNTKTQTSSASSPTQSQTILVSVLPQTDNILDVFNALAAHTNPLITSNLNWYPTSRHLIISSAEQVEVIEYDGNNRTTIFQTNLQENFAAPSPDGHHLIILTNLNQRDSPPNFFSLDLK